MALTGTESGYFGKDKEDHVSYVSDEKSIQLLSAEFPGMQMVRIFVVRFFVEEA